MAGGLGAPSVVGRHAATGATSAAVLVIKRGRGDATRYSFSKRAWPADELSLNVNCHMLLGAARLLCTVYRRRPGALLQRRASW